jgi:hypothetical protein
MGKDKDNNTNTFFVKTNINSFHGIGWRCSCSTAGGNSPFLTYSNEMATNEGKNRKGQRNGTNERTKGDVGIGNGRAWAMDNSSHFFKEHAERKGPCGLFSC